MFMVVWILILLWCVVFTVWSRRPRHPSPPVYPGALPIIGHAHLMLGDAIHLWDMEKKVYHFCLSNGGVVLFWFGPMPIYVITDLEDSLLVANTCLDKSSVYNFLKVVYKKGLLTANVSTWKPHRRILNLNFNQQVLNTFVDEYNTHARNLVSQLATQVREDRFDIQPYLISNFIKTAYSTTLGVKLHDHSETVKNYAHATEDFFALFRDRMQKFWLHFPIIFNMSSLKKKQDKLVKIIKDTTIAIINERKSELKADIKSLSNDYNTTSADKFKPLLDRMICLAEEQDAFTDDEIREHLDTIVAGAYDTSATAVTFTLILIGSYQDVQAKIYKELQEELGDRERDLNRYDLPKLVYMEAVIKESLRLFPTAPRIARNINFNVKLKHYTLPAGSSYIISLYGINRHPMWGADAEQFRPERWLDPTALPDNPNAFASFSLGRRNCIGKLYAMMAMKTTLAHILWHYRITGDISNVQTTCDIFQKPVEGHHIHLDLRT